MQSVVFQGRQICPSKVVCIGRNYVEHAKELGNEVPDEMVVFLKPNSAIGQTLYSELDEPLHFETELCLLMAEDGIAAVAVGLDLTKRALQSTLKAKGLPWERAKAFDCAALFSEFVAIDSLDSPIEVRLEIDGERRQQGKSSQMLFSPQRIVTQLRQWLTLEAGDIIMTGTPKGVGVVPQGATFVASLSQHGQMLVESKWHAR